MVVESWLNGAATAQTRGQILSLYGMTGVMAAIAGQLLLPSNDPSGFALFCLVAIILSFALVPISLSRATAPVHAAGASGISLLRLYRDSPSGAVAAFLCGVTTSSFFSLGPLVAQGRGMDMSEIALFMASGTLGGFLMIWPLGWISDRVDRRTVIIAAAIMAMTTLIALIAIVPIDSPPWVLYLCAVLFGGTIVPTYSIVLAHVNDMVAPGEFVAASGGLLIVLGVGSAAGPIVGGLAMSAFPYGLSSTIILAQLPIALWGAYRMTRRSAPAEAEKERFVLEPAVPVGMQLASAHVEGR
jgi:MFS family permease